MIFNLKQSYINNGKKQEGYACPIALILKEQTGKQYYAGTTACWTGCGPTIYFPKEVVKFIDDFDHDRVVKPFSFELPIENN